MSDGHHDPSVPDYVRKAAAEARAESQRFWAPGGWADKRYPKHPMPWWPEPGVSDGAEASRQLMRRRRLR
jgi:hypothetical protein